MSDDNTSAPVETVDASALSVDEAANDIAGLLDDEPEQPQARARAEPAPEAQQQDDGEGDEARDPDDWDTPSDTEAASDTENDEDGKEGDKPSEDGRFVGDTAKVRLPDGRVVTVAELRSGSMMQSDYTRKTQELAEQRRSVEARQAEFQQREQTLAQTRELVLALAPQLMPQEPDIGLLQTDPVGYIQAKHDYDQRIGQFRQLQDAQAQQQQVLGQQAHQEHQKRVSAEMDKFLERNPALKDPKKTAAFINEMGDYVGQYGISKEEALAVVDHRFAQVLMDATRYHRIQKNKAKSVEKGQGKPPVAQPGRRQSQEVRETRDRESAMARLKSTGSLKDGAAAIMDLI